MAYTPQQIADAIATSMDQGYSLADIVKGAQQNFGVGVGDIVNAMQAVHPDLYASTDSIMNNVNAGNFAANTNDPKFQNLQNLENALYAAAPAPAVPLSQMTFPANGPQPTVAQQPAQQPPGMQDAYSGGYGYFGTQSNPWLTQMADEIGRRTQQALGQAYNGIRSNAVGVGGLGGSRQGVAEALATRGAMDSLQGNLANLYGTDWTNAQNRGLQQYGLDTNAYLTNQGQAMNFYGQQRQQDQNGALLGAQLYGMGQQGAWGPINNAAGAYSPFSGYGSVSQTGQQGGGALGAVGGALGTYALGQKAGLWGNGTSPVGANWPTYGSGQFAGWGDPSGAYGAWT